MLDIKIHYLYSYHDNCRYLREPSCSMVRNCQGISAKVTLSTGSFPVRIEHNGPYWVSLCSWMTCWSAETSLVTHHNVTPFLYILLSFPFSRNSATPPTWSKDFPFLLLATFPFTFYSFSGDIALKLPSINTSHSEIKFHLIFCKNIFLRF